MNFDAQRDQARAYLGQFHQVTRLRLPAGSSRRDAPRLPYAERWAVEVEVGNGGSVDVMTLEVQVPRDFPLHPPRVYLGEADHRRLFPIPHVDDSRFVCTLDPAETVLKPSAAGAIVAAVVEKAIRVLEDGLEQRNVGDFDAEILAYWSQSYPVCGPADMRWVSLVEGDLGDNVYVLTPRRPLGLFTRIVHAGDALADRLKATLDASKNTYTEEKAFSLETISLGRPPFGLRNGSAVALVDARGRLDAFKRYLKSKPEVVTVLFQTKASAFVFGWQHAALPKPRYKARKGYHAARLHHIDALLGPDRAEPVQRITAQPYTPQRLNDRTAGDETPLSPQPRLLVAGLGSVGARLADSLVGATSALCLLDPEALSVENVGRHVLGLDDVGQNKAQALASRIRDADPLAPIVAISDRRLAEAVGANPELLGGYDRCILALGDLPTEMWFDAEMAAGRIRTPTLYVWVEPFMAGGHCVYVRPEEAQLSTLFADGRYVHDVIPASQHEARPFTRREAGCQTTFVPYADTYVRMFLAAAYPHVLDALRSDDATSFRLRWTGDLDRIRELGIEIMDDARRDGSFHMAVTPL